MLLQHNQIKTAVHALLLLGACKFHNMSGTRKKASLEKHSRKHCSNKSHVAYLAHMINVGRRLALLAYHVLLHGAAFK